MAGKPMAGVASKTKRCKKGAKILRGMPFPQRLPTLPNALRLLLVYPSCILSVLCFLFLFHVVGCCCSLLFPPSSSPPPPTHRVLTVVWPATLSQRCRWLLWHAWQHLRSYLLVACHRKSSTLGNALPTMMHFLTILWTWGYEAMPTTNWQGSI
jgi:hypothetical protein